MKLDHISVRNTNMNIIIFNPKKLKCIPKIVKINVTDPFVFILQ